MKKMKIFLTASVACLLSGAAALSGYKGIYIFGQASDNADRTVYIDSNSGMTLGESFAEATYNYRFKDSDGYAKWTFSSIKASENNVGVLEVGSTIVKDGPSYGLSSVTAKFSGGSLYAYTYMDSYTDEGSKIRYVLQSGVQTTIVGNYLKFEVVDSDVTLNSLAFDYSCVTAKQKTTDVINDVLPATHNTLKIEAENGNIVDPGNFVVIGTESKALSEVNNPSGDAFVHGLDKSTGQAISLTYQISADKAGLAVLSFCFGLSTRRSLEKMYSIQLNGKTLSIYNTEIVCPAFTETQYYDWTLVSGYLLNLDAGINTLVINPLYNSGDGSTMSPSLNLDYLSLDSELTLSVVEHYTTYDAHDYCVSTTATFNPASEPILGKYSGNYGSTGGKPFTFEVYVEEETSARMFLVAARNKPLTPDGSISAMNLNVGGGSYVFDDGIIGYSAWGAYLEAPIARLNLRKGQNIITFTITDGQPTNFAGISFISTVAPVEMLKRQLTVDQADLISLYGKYDENNAEVSGSRGITPAGGTGHYGDTVRYQSKSNGFEFTFALNSEKATSVSMSFNFQHKNAFNLYAAIGGNEDNVKVNGSSSNVTNYNNQSTSRSNWTAYTTVYFVTFNLNAGVNIVNIKFTTGNWNFNEMYFSSNSLDDVITLCAMPA